MRYVLTLLLAALFFGAIAEENTFRQLVQSEDNGVRIVSGTNLPAGTVRQAAPIMVYNSTLQGPTVDMINPGLVKSFQTGGYTMFDAKDVVNDLQKEKRNLRLSSFYNKQIFYGTWEDFLKANVANAEKDGKEFDSRGFLTMATQTLVLGVSLLAGAPVTAVANAGLTGTYGTFSKEDTQWFQSIQVDPSWAANPPSKVLVVKTGVATNQGKETSSTWTLVLLNEKVNLGNKAVAQSVANSIQSAVNQIVKINGAITPEETQILSNLNGLRSNNPTEAKHP
ncbi:MAG: hypothetical protein ACOYBQ_09465 [Fluviibacter sp.]